MFNYAPPSLPSGCAFLRFLCLTTLVAGMGLADVVEDGGTDGKRKEIIARAQEKYVDAQKRYLARPDHAEAAWQFARACFDRAEYPTNNAQRAVLAQQGSESNQVSEGDTP